MSLLGTLFERYEAGLDLDNFVMRPSRKLTKQDIVQIAERGASEFRANAMNLLSCYSLEGELGLYSTLGNYATTRGPANAEIVQAIQDGDEVALVEAFRRALEVAFVTLFKRGALKRLQLVEKWPPEATAEFARMYRYVVAAEPVPEPVTIAPADEVAQESPTEVCAREFRQLGSDQFRKKYLNHAGNRRIYEQAFSEGKI